MDNNTSVGNDTSTERKPFKWQAIYLTYAIAMFLVLTVGFLGNVVTLIILRYPAHRRKVITPLMINLAVAHLLIIVLVYPVIVASNLLGWSLQEGSILCKWSSFGNGAAGIASIATLATMSGSMCYVIRQTVPHPRIHTRYITLLVIGTWLYGILLNLPPVIGWSKAVPGKAGISCAPDWTTSDPNGIIYIVFLLAFGFFLPLWTIGTFHYLIYRLIQKVPLPGNTMIQASRRRSKMKLIRMTSVSIAAFLMSWLPYCIVSIAALVNGRHVLSSGEAEFPELMAKASVIYNPIVYAVMSGAYRTSLRKMITGNNEPRVTPNITISTAALSSYLNPVAINPNQEDTAV